LHIKGEVGNVHLAEDGDDGGEEVGEGTGVVDGGSEVLFSR
jgi:hypothetical protein